MGEAANLMPEARPGKRPMHHKLRVRKGQVHLHRALDPDSQALHQIRWFQNSCRCTPLRMQAYLVLAQPAVVVLLALSTPRLV
jgi:hypothetical protein